MMAANPNSTSSAPRVINVDNKVAYPKAIVEPKASGTLPESVELQQVKYLNNIIASSNDASTPGWAFSL